MDTGYLIDMAKTLDIAVAFVQGRGIRWCPDCGTELTLNPKDPWINGVLCPHCEKTFPWQHWVHFGEKWRWGDDNTSLVSFYGDESGFSRLTSPTVQLWKAVHSLAAV